MYERPSLITYYLKIADVVASRSTCIRHKIGAVAVRDKHILAAGYNGASAGLPDCLHLGCLRDQLHIQSGKNVEVCRAVHAEQNLIIYSGMHSNSLKGATVYCTHSPCNLCAKMLINAGIIEYAFSNDYADTGYVDLFSIAGISVVKHAIG